MELAVIFSKNNITNDCNVQNDIFILEYDIKKGGIFSRENLIISTEEIQKMKIKSKKNESLDLLIVSFSNKMNISQKFIDYLDTLGVHHSKQNFKITSCLNFYALGYKDEISTNEAVLVLYLLNDQRDVEEDFEDEILPTPPSCPKIISPQKILDHRSVYVPEKAFKKINCLGKSSTINIAKKSTLRKPAAGSGDNRSFSKETFKPSSLPNNSGGGFRKRTYKKKKIMKKSDSTPEKMNEL